MGKGVGATDPRGADRQCCQAYWNAGDTLEHLRHGPEYLPISDGYEARD